MDESDLTKEIKHRVFHYLEEKYSSSAIAKLLDVCNFLDPRFKIDYVQKCDRIDVKAKVEVEAVLIAEKSSTMSTTTEQQTAGESAGTYCRTITATIKKETACRYFIEVEQQ